MNKQCFAAFSEVELGAFFSQFFRPSSVFGPIFLLVFYDLGTGVGDFFFMYRKANTAPNASMRSPHTKNPIAAPDIPAEFGSTGISTLSHCVDPHSLQPYLLQENAQKE
jgi:hypothetical protein